MSRNTVLHIEEPVAASELAGDETGQFVRIDKDWFEVMPLSGREYIQAQQQASNVTHRLRCDYRTGMHSRLRITAGNDPDNPTRVFNVRSVVNVEEKNRELEWMCEEVV